MKTESRCQREVGGPSEDECRKICAGVIYNGHTAGKLPECYLSYPRGCQAPLDPTKRKKMLGILWTSLEVDGHTEKLERETVVSVTLRGGGGGAGDCSSLLLLLYPPLPYCRPNQKPAVKTVFSVTHSFCGSVSVIV